MKSNRSWTMATVRSVRSVTPTVREITLVPEGGAERWAPGAHIDVEACIFGRPATRSYSLVGPAEASVYRIAVKRVEGSRGGSVYMTSLEVGARLSITAPKNDFELGLEAPEYLLVAGGIGVTPIVAMALELDRRRLPFRLLYAARNAPELAYGDLLAQTLGDRLQIFLSDRGEMIEPAHELASLAPEGEAYVCGPSPLLTAFREAWRTGARPLERLRFETFGNSGVYPPEPFRVRVPQHGVDILVKENENLLDALLAAGVEILYDCRRGECGLCVVDVLELVGEIDHRDVFLGAEERRSNARICTCVSRAVRGEVVLASPWRPDRLRRESASRD